MTGYGYGAGSAGPHAVTSASIDGVSHTLGYDLNGAVTSYDIAGTSDDKYLAYNAFNQPVTIVIGESLTDSTPEAKDEFAYDPNGQRYARKTEWQDGANTYTEEVAYIGAVEVISDDSTGSTQTITKTRLSHNVMHVKIVGAGTETFFEYAHRDHLGSIEAVTDDNGNVLDRLAFEPFGSRKGKDWTSNISASELDSLLALSSGHTRKARGFTGHEHLDRTGFIHMNGRVFDPVLGRFLSPDPIVQFPFFSQSWNRYSYVGNTPTSFTDPTGFQEHDPNCEGPDCDPNAEVDEEIPGWFYDHELLDPYGGYLNERLTEYEKWEFWQWLQSRNNPTAPPDPFANETDPTADAPAVGYYTLLTQKLLRDWFVDSRGRELAIQMCREEFVCTDADLAVDLMKLGLVKDFPAMNEQALEMGPLAGVLHELGLVRTGNDPGEAVLRNLHNLRCRQCTGNQDNPFWEQGREVARRELIWGTSQSPYAPRDVQYPWQFWPFDSDR